MSRALEKDVAASMTREASAEAYSQISRILNQAQGDDELLEIEILGKSHPLEPGTYLLQDENAAAISKLGLVQAFFVARKLFISHKDGTSKLSDDDLLAATSVILLMDPEHLTAANARKSLIMSHNAPSDQMTSYIRKDKLFVDSLLTSRLHRHTKSPTLWSHRRWLIGVAKSYDIQTDAIGEVQHIVMIAGERHPRNYYAWCHARWLTESKSGDETEELLATVKDWCFRNHTDVCGWSYLYSLLTCKGLTAIAKVCCSVFTETISLAVSFHWVNESVWVFLRTLAASGTVGEQEIVLFSKTMATLKDSTPVGSQDRRVLEAAESWCETYRR